MDITQLSTGMSMATLQNNVGFAVMAKALDQVEQAGDGMQKIMEASVTPYLGQNIDYSV